MEAARGKTVDNLPQMGGIPSFQNNIDVRLFGWNIEKKHAGRKSRRYFNRPCQCAERSSRGRSASLKNPLCSRDLPGWTMFRSHTDGRSYESKLPLQEIKLIILTAKRSRTRTPMIT